MQMLHSETIIKEKIPHTLKMSKYLSEYRENKIQ